MSIPHNIRQWGQLAAEGGYNYECMIFGKSVIRLTLKSGLGDNIYSREPPIRGVIASNCFTNYKATNGHTKW